MRPIETPREEVMEHLYFPRTQPQSLRHIPWAESDKSVAVRGDAAVLWVCAAIGAGFLLHSLF